MTDEQPSESEGRDLLHIVVDAVSRLARVEANDAQQDTRLSGMEGAMATLSGQVEGVASQGERHEREMLQMRAAVDQVLAVSTELKAGQAAITVVLARWEPVLLDTQATLKDKAIKDSEHLVEIRLLSRRTEALRLWVKRGVAIVVGMGAVAGALVELHNLGPLWPLAVGHPALALGGAVVVLVTGIVVVVRLLPWPTA